MYQGRGSDRPRSTTPLDSLSVQSLVSHCSCRRRDGAGAGSCSSATKDKNAHLPLSRTRLDRGRRCARTRTTTAMAMRPAGAMATGAQEGGGVDLRMENVSVSYGGRAVVDGVSMGVRKGEIVGVLGPNGAGKSTAFNVMVGRERPTGGAVFWGAVDVTRMSLPQRARLGIGYLTQEASIFRGLTVHDNIRLVLQETGAPRHTHTHRIHELVKDFSLQPVEHTLGRALSGGERRRTELARALASKGPPDVLLVDEPFAGVDPIGVTEIQRQLRRLCEEAGMGILITDHNVNETLRICDRAYMVHRGGVVASGAPEQLCRDPYVKKHYLGDGFQRW